MESIVFLEKLFSSSILVEKEERGGISNFENDSG